MRILPRVNDAVNEEWISDKTRQVVDGLKAKRLDKPFVRKDGKLVLATWAEAFAAIAAKVKGASGKRIGAIAGDLCSVEEMFALKSLMASLGSPNLDCRQDGTKLDPALGRASYLFNATVEGIEQADALLIVGSNPRRESPVLNARIRKRWLKGHFPIGVIGEALDLTYPYTYLGAGPETLGDVPKDFAEILGKAERPLVLVGQGALARADGAAILAAAAKLATTSNLCARPFRPAHRCGSRRRRPRSRLRAGRRRPRRAGHGQSGRPSTWCFCSAPTRSRSNAVPSRSISGPTATAAPRVPTSCCRRRPTPRNPGSTSTPRAGCNLPTEPISRRAMPARIGRSCARCPTGSATSCHSIRSPACAPSSTPRIRTWPASTRSRTGPVADFSGIAQTTLGRDPFASPIVDFYLTNPIARASKVMAEASALAQAPIRQAAE